MQAYMVQGICCLAVNDDLLLKPQAELDQQPSWPNDHPPILEQTDGLGQFHSHMAVQC